MAQNGQPTAQPAWLEMHSVWRSRWIGRPADPIPARRVVHQNRLDERPVREQVERLLGQAAVGDGDLVVGDRVDAERLADAGPQARPGGS